ncbi:MAG: TlpA disulfide reductase family protein, partial [Bacteroidota bacterium]
TTFRKRVERVYTAIAQLEVGAPSPRFTGYINAQGGTSDLEDFLGQGKYVYVDLWATWCGACMIEQPHLEELMATYEGTKLEIISIAWNDKQESWRKAVAEKGKNEIHLWAPKSSDPFSTGYGVTSLPRYILLDPEGKIISYNAPRPSDKEALRALLEELGI